MIVNGETIELVTDIKQLRVGVITYVNGCKVCGRGWCRGVVVGPAKTPGSWHVLPNCASAPKASTIGGASVARGTTYVVVDPLLTADSLASDARRVEALADLAARARGERVR